MCVNNIYIYLYIVKFNATLYLKKYISTNSEYKVTAK